MTEPRICLVVASVEAAKGYGIPKTFIGLVLRPLVRAYMPTLSIRTLFDTIYQAIVVTCGWL